MKKTVYGAIICGLLIPMQSYATNDYCLYCVNLTTNVRQNCMDCYTTDRIVQEFWNIARNDNGANISSFVAFMNVEAEQIAQDMLDDMDADVESICYSYCMCDCPEDWTDISNGIQRSLDYTCDMGECVASGTRWRCRVGYYGNPTSDTSGCTRCPASGGIYGTTLSPGGMGITQCFIPSGTASNDSAGEFTYTGDCYWRN